MGASGGRDGWERGELVGVHCHRQLMARVENDGGRGWLWREKWHRGSREVGKTRGGQMRQWQRDDGEERCNGAEG